MAGKQATPPRESAPAQAQPTERLSALSSLGTAELVVGQPKPPSWLRRQVKLHAYIGETVFLVVLLASLNMGLLPSNPGFYGVEPNPLFAVILLMAARYGFRAGLLAALLSAATYYYLVSANIGTIAPRDLLLWQYARPPVLFIVVGVILGMLAQRTKDRVRLLEQENQLLARDNAQLQRGEEELRDVNVELANRVVGATETLPVLYKYAKRLNSLDVDAIYTGLTELAVEVIRAERVSVYRVEGDQLLLHSRNGYPAEGNERKERLGLDPELFERVVKRRGVITLHDLLAKGVDSQQLFLCGPLGAADQPAAALLAVERLEFLRYSPATVRLFKVVIDWAASSIERAERFVGQPEERQRLKNRKTLIRAQRATLGAQTLARSATVVGEVDGGEATPGVMTATATPKPASAPVVPVRPGLSLPGGLGGGLGAVLSEAEQQLFGEPAARAEATGGLEGAATEINIGQDRAALQAMLSGELQIANAQGNGSLTKLLAEIDSFLTQAPGDDID